jgi:uncharacterized protein YoxC
MYKAAMTLILIAGPAIAAPTIYPTDITALSALTNYTTSNLVADNVDARRVYVMPPTVASATVGNLHTITANVGFCQEMADAKNYSRSLLQKIKQLTLDEVEAKGEADAIRLQLAAAREAASNFTTQARLQDLADLDTVIATSEGRLTDLYNQANTCNTTCDLINKEIDGLVKNKAELLKTRRQITAAHAQDVRVYEHHRAKIENLKLNLADLDESWTKITQRVSQVRSDFQAIYKTFGKMEGARASLSFSSNWDKNVETLRLANPGIEFEKIQTQKAVVLSNIAISSSLPPEGAILSYEVGGMNVEGQVDYPSYPESLAGNVRLSLIGTCPVLHPDLFEINLPNGTDQMKYGLTISYEYPTVFSVNATAKYNMYKMYSKVVSSGSSGGFFSSRSWSSVEERNFFKDSFVVHWDEQDPAVALPDEQKAAIEAEMRKNIFDRIANLALPQTPDRSGIILSVGAPKHGSVVLADSLMKTCPGNVYCVAASIGLNVLDAIFGSSKTSSSYMQTYDTEGSESFSRTKVVFKPAITSYQ